jgi:hypothetical protein
MNDGLKAADHLRALQRALAAGDTEAADYIRQQAIAAQEAEDRTEYNPSAGNSFGQNLREGVGRGMVNVGRHLGNVAGLVDDEQLAESKALDAPLMQTGGGQVGSMVGEVAATAPLMVGGAGLLGRVGMGAKALANPITRGVAEGVAQGALMADPGQKAEGALLGGALGGVLPAAGAVAGKVAHGIKRTPEAQLLLDKGVDLTPGQMNPSGILNQMEESWQSVPGVGAVIRGARDNAQNSFQRVAAETAAAPGARIAAGEADDMLAAAYRSFEPLYDQAKGFPVPPQVTAQLGPAFDAVTATTAVPASATASASGFLKNQLTRAVSSSDDLLDMRSAIRTRARNLRNSPGSNPDHIDAADLLEAAEAELTKAIEAVVPPDGLQALRTADSRYGIYKTLEDAVARSKDTPGGFTAAKLSEAVASGNRGLGKGSYARGGGGPLRELSNAGTATMNVRSPPTGQRLAAIGLPIVAGTAAPEFAVPAGAALLGAVGTQTGRRAMAGLTRPQLQAQAMEEAYRQRLSQPARDVTAQYLRRALVSGLLPQG